MVPGVHLHALHAIEGTVQTKRMRPGASWQAICCTLLVVSQRNQLHEREPLSPQKSSFPRDLRPEGTGGGMNETVVASSASRRAFDNTKTLDSRNHITHTPCSVISRIATSTGFYHQRGRPNSQQAPKLMISIMISITKVKRYPPSISTHRPLLRMSTRAVPRRSPQHA